ncbi:MAG TPA: hypothetical protein VF852_04455, partial [Pseudolabrys sp.]
IFITGPQSTATNRQEAHAASSRFLPVNRKIVDRYHGSVKFVQPLNKMGRSYLVVREVFPSH